jgi:acetolactate synthase-1/2/3 large subunit
MDMLKIDRPALDWVSLAKGMGVAGRSVDNVDDFVKALAEGVADKGPRLIEVKM